MPDPKFVAYIDEAGCSGDKYGGGSSHFLAIGAIVFPIQGERDVLAVFDEARSERGHERKFKKFSETKEKDNFVLTKVLSTKKALITQVALHKPSMAGTFLRANHKEEYQYLVKFVLERVSWIAKAAARGGSSDTNKVKLVFSNQDMYPYDELASYLTKLQKGQARYNCSVNWDFVHEEFTSQRHQNETGIHLADIIASSLHMAIEPKQHGITDDRFQRNLLPMIFRSYGKPAGLKLFPTREISQMKANGDFGFMRFIL
ncbi:DUF3800 domain-containing protein [Methylocystis sp. H4A]|uniref:DUF3800 domain-containing protein n=1 Tax=Methylocystis sp. H4A TaxID=2785788 RepID=UPI001A1A0875|nr:DUF3800 domain-containing protein [Methylocystis sp. H4A]MBG0800838.1 DUF3800 domain-containing protein [Methylocystis sp. H4A]